MREYKFKTEPFDHQRRALEDSWAADYYALFMEMGTGKSKVAIDTMGVLHKAKKVSAALILAPKGVYDNWVQGEIPTHLPDDIKRSIVRWSPSTSKKFQETLELIPVRSVVTVTRSNENSDTSDIYPDAAVRSLDMLLFMLFMWLLFIILL